jgi:hypothetical protein
MAKIPKLGRVILREHDAKSDTYYVDVEWIDDEGYRVVGMFSQFGWKQPPRAFGEKMQAALSKPPKVLYGRRPS